MSRIEKLPQLGKQWIESGKKTAADLGLDVLASDTTKLIKDKWRGFSEMVKKLSVPILASIMPALKATLDFFANLPTTVENQAYALQDQIGIEILKRGNGVTDTVYEAIKKKKFVGRSSHDWVEKVYGMAGFVDQRKERLTVFDKKVSGKYLDRQKMEMIMPGDWLVIKDASALDGERSVIFLGWKNKKERIAKVATSYGGGSFENTKPGEEKIFDFDEYPITRFIKPARKWEKPENWESMSLKQKVLWAMEKVLEARMRGDHCWNWVEKVFLVAGIPRRKIEFSTIRDYEGIDCKEHHLILDEAERQTKIAEITEREKAGEEVPQSEKKLVKKIDFEPGDWLFINNKNPGPGGNHSIIFLGWKSEHVAYAASCPGKQKLGHKHTVDFRETPIVLVQKPA